MIDSPQHVVNVEDVEEVEHLHGDHFGGCLEARGDEVFHVRSGPGMPRDDHDGEPDPPRMFALERR